MSTELKKKAVKAAQAFLLHRDFDILEVLDDSDTFDIVADDGQQIVFVEVAVRFGTGECVTADEDEELKNTVEKLRKIHQHMIPED